MGTPQFHDFFETPQDRAAATAALPRHAQHLESLNRNAFSRDVADDLKLEVAGRVEEIQGEGTAVRIAVVTHCERFTEVDGSHEVSVRIVRPHAVSELESPLWSMLPHSQADVSTSRINIRIVNLCPPGIPELVRFLDGLTADHELDVPKAYDARVVAVAFGSPRIWLDRAGLTMDGSSPRCHRGQGIAARRERTGAESNCQDHAGSKLDEVQSLGRFHNASPCESGRPFVETSSERRGQLAPAPGKLPHPVLQAVLYRLTAATAAMQNASPAEQFGNTAQVIHC